MAQFNINTEEIVNMLNKNIQSKQIDNFKSEGKSFLIDIKTGMPFIEKISVSLEFLRFEEGKVYFEAKSKFTLDKLMSLSIVKEKIEKHLTHPHLMLDLPNLSFDVNALLKEKANELQIDDIQFEENKFIIITNVQNVDFKEFTKKK